MPFAVTIHKGEKTIRLNAGQGHTLREILIDAGVYLPAPCAGRGRCGKCRVRVKGGVSPASAEELRLLKREEIETGVRLACAARPAGDLEITVPEEPDMEIELPEGVGYTADASKLSPLLPAGAGKPGTHRKLAGMAVDIGTTTLAVRFFDLRDGRLLGFASAVNAQTAYGADVISRIAACSRMENGLIKLKSLLDSQINAMIRAFSVESGCGREDILSCVLAGNTVMLHIAAGLDPAPIAMAPFEPVSRFGFAVRAEAAGIEIRPDAPVFFMPCISGYIGGDITAGLLSCGIDRESGPGLFLDLGTNGETALWRDGHIYCCSVAAGPVFEGAHIKDGVASVPGAISGVWADPSGIRIGTILNKKPVGICGSGLIDAAALMLELRAVDETGRMSRDSAAGGCRFTEAGGGLKLILDEESGVGVTQEDIRELQLAKAAVAAGVSTLMKLADVREEEITRVYLAGGFGAHINPESACAVGLLPASMLGKITTVGNASLSGAEKVLLFEEYRKRLDALTKSCQSIELSGNPDFSERFIESMGFDAEDWDEA